MRPDANARGRRLLAQLLGATTAVAAAEIVHAAARIDHTGKVPTLVQGRSMMVRVALVSTGSNRIGARDHRSVQATVTANMPPLPSRETVVTEKNVVAVAVRTANPVQIQTMGETSGQVHSKGETATARATDKPVSAVRAHTSGLRHSQLRSILKLRLMRRLKPWAG